MMLEETATAAGFVQIKQSIQITHFMSRRFAIYLVN